MNSECQLAPLDFISIQALRFFGGPAPFSQGIPEALFPSGATVTAIPPNHSPDDITGSGSLTNPSPTPSKTTSDSRKENGATQTAPISTPWVLSPIDRFSRVSTPRSRSPPQVPQTRDSTKEKSGQGCESGDLIRLYSPQGEVTPTTSSAAEPSLSVPERKLDADAGERKTAQALEGVATVFDAWDHCFQSVETEGEGIKGGIDTHSASRRTRQSHHNLRIHQPRTSTTIATPGPSPATFSSRCYKATRKLSLPSSESPKELRKWIFHPAALAYSWVEHERRAMGCAFIGAQLSPRIDCTSQQQSTTSYRSTVK
ncbi:hypothetical protein BKA70DRAFT_1563203 [Coprinopsis sp. MPI-PUGE-AT-0042]|nr:hypothetical protein BKA70DRAFT_1563203 [Coprinopsis sp. MPI-PUGE-AT-0042]